MKTENVTNELVLGNKNNTSSHYRINYGGTKVQLMAVIDGNEPLSKCEFLMCQVGHRSEFITAYIIGKVVKLFKLVDYVDWECFDKKVPSVEISFDKYIHSDTFLDVVLSHFLAIHPKPEAV